MRGRERCHRNKVFLDHLEIDAYKGGRTGGRYLKSVEAPEASIIHDAWLLEKGGDGFEGVWGSIRYSLAFRQSSRADELVAVY